MLPFQNRHPGESRDPVDLRKYFGFKTCALLCFVTGSLSSFAMAPTGFYLVLAMGLSFLYFAIARASSPAISFLYGWLFGFGYFVFSLIWVGNALIINGNPYAWAWPLAVCGLPFILSFFPAFACLMAKCFSNLKKVSGFIAFAAFMAFFEWARGHVFTGFPWNLYGHTWAKNLPMLQVLSFSDVYWLTWLTVLWFAAPGFFLASDWRGADKKILALSLILAFGFCLSFGFWRLQSTSVPPHDGIQLHIVQANIPQSEKWTRQSLWDNFYKQLDLSQPDDPDSTLTTYIIWPETALNQWVLDDPKALHMIRELLGLYKGNAYLMTGLLRHSPDRGSFYNSLVMIDKLGNIENVYDKNHLVPFGEYIPFQNWIPLEPVARFKGFSGGAGPQTFSTPEGIKYSPVICYEIIFPERVADRAHSPDFILNITNDSWYGNTAGPWQHLYQAVYRAIEEGIPVIRVADTGVSAVIDSTGHITEKSQLFEEYEKTLALPGKNVVSKVNNSINMGIYLFIILCCVSVGFIRKHKN